MVFFFFKFFYLYKRFWFDSLLLQILQQLYLCSPCWYFDHYQHSVKVQKLLLRCLCHIQIGSLVRYPKEMAVLVCWQYFPHHPKVKVLFPTKKDVVVPKTFFIISLRKKKYSLFAQKLGHFCFVFRSRYADQSVKIKKGEKFCSKYGVVQTFCYNLYFKEDGFSKEKIKFMYIVIITYCLIWNPPF